MPNSGRPVVIDLTHLDGPPIKVPAPRCEIDPRTADLTRAAQAVAERLDHLGGLAILAGALASDLPDMSVLVDGVPTRRPDGLTALDISPEDAETLRDAQRTLTRLAEAAEAATAAYLAAQARLWGAS